MRTTVIETTVPPTKSHAPSGETAVSTLSNAVVYSTYGGGLVTVTGSATSESFTPATSTQVVVTTGGNGEQSTSTAVVVVNASASGTENGQSGSAGAASSSSAPGLQNGATTIKTPLIGSMAVLLVGVSAGAILLL